MELTESEALTRAAAYFSTAEHCRFEVAAKLQQWGIGSEAAERILNRLEQEKFIDEERFCRAFIRDKYRFAKWGKLKIGEALRAKQISSALYRPCFEVIDTDEYYGILQQLLAAKRKSVKAKNDYERNGKLMRFALSRGFEMNDIRRCIDVPDENECF